MTKARLDGLLLFLLGSAMFVLLGSVGERISPASMADFKGPYYGARCLVQHADPYLESDMLRVYLAEQGGHPSTPDPLRKVVTLYVNLPTAFLLTVPIAMLPWGAAQLLWMVLTGTSVLLAAYLIWSLSADFAPVTSGALVCIFLFSSELLLEIGNAAGIAVSLCVIAVWCLLKERFPLAGILCFTLSLAVKPHVSGLIWLFFLLAGGLYRKRALQILAVTVVLSIPSLLAISYVAPHWISELQANLQTTSAHGELNDPGPASVDPRFHGAIQISLQTVASVFRDDPRFYNTVTYLLVAPLALAWAIGVFRKRFSQESAWLALAPIAVLSMLPLYHRLHDTRLLLLVFPAFAMIWAQGGVSKWLALLFTGAGVVITDDIVVQLLAINSAHLRESTPGFAGQVLTVLLARPVPLVLLAMGIFYLWFYLRHATVMDLSAASQGCLTPLATDAAIDAKSPIT